MSIVTMTPFNLNCGPLEGYLGMRTFIWSALFLPILEVATPHLLSELVNQTADTAAALFKGKMDSWRAKNSTCLLPLNGRVFSDKKCNYAEPAVCTRLQAAVAAGLVSLKSKCQTSLSKMRNLTIPAIALDVTALLPRSCKRVVFPFHRTGNQYVDQMVVRTADLTGGPLVIPAGTTL